MHASNLLKAVLKPRNITSSSSGQPLTTSKSEGKSRSTRSSSTDNGLSALTVTKKQPAAPAKMSCLCAPTSHAGSFRCRLHRGGQQQWGGRPLTPVSSKPSSPTATPDTKPSSTPVSVENGGGSKRSPLPLPTAAQRLLPTLPSARLAAMNPLRSCDSRPSRLSRVVIAPDATSINAPIPTANRVASEGTTRFLKFTGGASAAVLETGVVAIRKLQASGKDVMLDVFGSGAGLGQAGFTL